MKSQITIILIMIALAIGVFIGMNYGQEQKNASLLEVKSLKELTPLQHVDVEYPQFLSLNEELNKEISDIVNNKVNEFKNNSQSNWEAMKEVDDSLGENPEMPFYFSLSWSPVQINDKYISFMMETYSFSGGAHGNQEVYSFNYDVKNNKKITITDMVGNLKEFSNLAKEDAQMQIGDALFEEGLLPQEENFNTFTFSSEVLTIYYQKYQIAPGAMGITKSIFNKESLRIKNLNTEYFLQ